jgi:hypothetical protein
MADWKVPGAALALVQDGEAPVVKLHVYFRRVLTGAGKYDDGSPTRFAARASRRYSIHHGDGAHPWL